ncbi:MAG: glycosyltransferase family 2 protein [Candidatus Sericytochromatia bacterium]|nr:glycosyltransferase family 2 protein [Candidatus Sericytochromatia bacterium]
MKAKISVCMIVKNEAPCLARCLESVKGIADEIIIVDTGSEDQTVQIAHTFTDKVFHFDWCDDFSAARNESLKHATGDWILILDADEVLAERAQKHLKTFLAQQNPSKEVVFNFQVVTSGEQPLFTRACFPNHLGIRFKGQIHEWPALDHRCLPGIECPDFVLYHHPKPFTLEKLNFYKTLIEAELLTDLSPHEKAVYYYHLGQTEQKRHQSKAALSAFAAGRKAYLESGAVQISRLYHNLLVPLLRLSLLEEVSWQDTLRYSQELSTLFPGFVEGWLYLAYCEFWLGDLASAQSHYEHCLSQLIDPQIPEPVKIRSEWMAQLGLARIALLNRQFANGYTLLEKLYHRQPNRETAGHLVCAALYQQNQKLAQKWADIAQASQSSTNIGWQEVSQWEIWSPLESQAINKARAQQGSVLAEV